MTSTTTNYEKHSTKNPISRFFLNNFLKTVIETIKEAEEGLYSSSEAKLNREVQGKSSPQGRTIKKIDSILDVGCGEGFTLNRLQQEGIGKTLEGVDAVDEALAIGRKLYPKLTLKMGNIYDLQYKSNSFELILCTEVLEHMDDPDKALQELIRVSKKYVLLTVPNEPWFTYMRILRGKNLLQFGAHPEHVNVWSSNAFEKFVKRTLSDAESSEVTHAMHIENNSGNSMRRGIKKEKITIVVKKHPFPWTMLLIEKKL